MKEQIEELGRAFEEFKKTNEQRLSEIKANGAANPLTEAKLSKIEADLQKMEWQNAELVKAMGRTNQGTDEKQVRDEKAAKIREDFKSFMRTGNASEELKAHSVGSDADGGYLVSPEVSSEMVKNLVELSPMRQLASVASISTNKLQILTDLQQPAAGWTTETGARSTSATAQFGRLEIAVEEMYAMPACTQMFLDDASINVESWLAEKLVEKFAGLEASAFVSGDGTGKPKGITAYASGTNGTSELERVVAASATVITADELINLQTELNEKYQGNAVFMMNRSIVAAVRKLKSNDNQYIWQPGLQAGVPSLLLGKPVALTPDLPSSGSASADVVIYGDIKAGYQIVDRIGIRVLRDQFTNKPYVNFYTTKRVGGGVKDFNAIKLLRQAAV